MESIDREIMYLDDGIYKTAPDGTVFCIRKPQIESNFGFTSNEIASHVVDWI